MLVFSLGVRATSYSVTSFQFYLCLFMMMMMMMMIIIICCEKFKVNSESRRSGLWFVFEAWVDKD